MFSDKLWEFNDEKEKKINAFTRCVNSFFLPFDGIVFYMKGIKYKLLGTRVIHRKFKNIKKEYIVDLIENQSTKKCKAFFRQDLIKLYNKRND